MKRTYILMIGWVLVGLLGVSCDGQDGPEAGPATAVSLPTTLPTAAIDPTPLPPTEIPPTATPSEPMAALVNDQPIFLADYEQELARYEQAQAEMGSTPDADYRALVLDVLIEKELIAQAAAQRGITVTTEAVDAKLVELENAAGESGNFDAWLLANQYTREQFQTALAEEMLTEAVVAEVTADVPATAEQVKARYLQVDDAALAESLRQQIQAGADFGALASQYSLDQVTAESGGDLGYFARGSLLVTAVEEAAFELQPGEVSEVITDTGADGQSTYYLVQTLERDGERPLSADMRYTMLQQAFETWLDGLWQSAEITRFIES
jgi:parvulin-like peptidyl-prolyl isomerase